MKLVSKARADWRASTCAALIGSGLGLALGAAYMAGGMARTATDHARASRIADAAAGGFSEDVLQRQAEAMSPGMLKLAARHDSFIGAETAQRDRQNSIIAAYQDRRYATLYLDRLQGMEPAIIRDVARHLAVRMSFEDIIRVAQAKTSRERLDRVRAEVRAKAHEPVEITEHFKPGNEEIAALLPPWAAHWLLARRPFHFSMHVRSTTAWGFARLRFLAGLRLWRPHSSRYVEEQAGIERWLDQIRAAQAPLAATRAKATPRQTYLLG